MKNRLIACMSVTAALVTVLVVYLVIGAAIILFPAAIF